MKTLYMVRHAKSSWEDPSRDDAKRQLLPKGEKRTLKVCEFLNRREEKPALIISSHAVRAYETAKIIAGELSYPLDDIQVDDNLYFTGFESAQNIVLGLPDSLDSVMLVGHNPDMTNFANLFLDEKTDYMPTSAIVGVRFETHAWSEVFLSKKEVLFYIQPSLLP